MGRLRYFDTLTALFCGFEFFLIYRYKLCSTETESLFVYLYFMKNIRVITLQNKVGRYHFCSRFIRNSRNFIYYIYIYIYVFCKGECQ